MTFLNLCKNLLIRPISFLDNLLKGEEHFPLEIKKKLDRVFYEGVFYSIVFCTFLGFIKAYFLGLYSGEHMSLNIFIFAILITIVCIGFLAFSTWLIILFMLRLNTWIFEKAVYWSGGQISKKKATHLSQYLLASYIIRVFLFEVIFDLIENIPLLNPSYFKIIYTCFSFCILGSIIYVRYKIIKKNTDAKPLLCLFLEILIIFSLVFCFCICIGLIALCAYYIFNLLSSIILEAL